MLKKENKTETIEKGMQTISKNTPKKKHRLLKIIGALVVLFIIFSIIGGEDDSDNVSNEHPNADFKVVDEPEAPILTDENSFDGVENTPVVVNNVSIGEASFGGTLYSLELNNASGDDIREMNVSVQFYDKNGLPLLIQRDMGETTLYTIPLTINNLVNDATETFEFSESQIEPTNIGYITILVASYTTFEDETMINIYSSEFENEGGSKIDDLTVPCNVVSFVEQ